MGGALAFHFGYRFCTHLAGVFALSTFLSEKSSVYDVSGISIYYFVSCFCCCLTLMSDRYHYCTSCLQT